MTNISKIDYLETGFELCFEQQSYNDLRSDFIKEMNLSRIATIADNTAYFFIYFVG